MRGTYIITRIPGFYAALEKELNPELWNRPLAVSIGSGFRAVVLSSCERAARRGILPGARLGNLNIEGVEIVPASAEKYADGNERMIKTLSLELPDVRLLRPGVFAAFWEGGSNYLKNALERAFANVENAGQCAAWGLSRELASAEIASLVAKLGALVRIPEGEERAFLQPLPVHLVPDLNPMQVALLKEMGVHTIGELSAIPGSALRRMFGPEGPLLLEIARTGKRPLLKPQWRVIRKLGEDAEDPAILYGELSHLLAEGIGNVHALGQTPERLILTLIYADRKRTTGQIKPGKNQHEGNWQKAAHQLAQELWKRRVRIGEIRISLTYKQASADHQLRLFEPPGSEADNGRLSDAVLSIRKRWGTSTIRFASAHFTRGNPFQTPAQP